MTWETSLQAVGVLTDRWEPIGAIGDLVLCRRLVAPAVADASQEVVWIEGRPVVASKGTRIDATEEPTR